VTKKIQDILSPEEVVRIVGSLNPRTEIGARDQALFVLLLDTGMRLSELCNLRLSGLHLEEGYAKVHGKGKKERPVRVGALAAKAVRFYLLHWRRPARSGIDHVFLTCRGVTRQAGAFAPEAGEPLKPKAVELMIKRLGRRVGVPRLHPHLLRHTFSCRHLIAHHDPFALKSLLGHTTLAMTNHYCAAVQQMEIVQAERASVLDEMDWSALRINRRGRLPKREERTS
jgi:site-specific recombinase XerD